MGQAVGIQGQTYALPSKHIENLKKHIDDFLLYAEQHPEYIFLVTEIGCGISKHSPFEIAPLFKEAVHINIDSILGSEEIQRRYSQNCRQYIPQFEFEAVMQGYLQAIAFVTSGNK